MSDDPNATAPRLASVGQVYVTLAAAERYAEFSGELIEGARKELTAILLHAHLVRAEGDLQVWRYRSRSRDLDLSARTVREGDLLVVVSATMRSDAGGQPGAGARARHDARRIVKPKS